MPTRTKRRRNYTTAEIYRDATVLLQRLGEKVKNMHKVWQYSLGEDVLRAVAEVQQILRFAYDKPLEEKMPWIMRLSHQMARVEVLFEQLKNVRGIEIRNYEMFSEVLGRMQDGVEKWQNGVRQRLLAERKKKKNEEG